ncbi:MAG: YihY/virulence factor BrkB family protein [Propionibacteriaceae bacterium]
MKRWLDKVLDRRWIAHLLRANLRFGNRLGNQFAAAISYFSVLAMVPIIMFAFSMVGMTLTEFRPEWLDVVKRVATRQMANQHTQLKVGELIETAMQNWATIGLFGLAAALFAAQGWVSNLKSAVQAQWSPSFDLRQPQRNWFLERLVNMGIFIALIILFGVLTVLANIGTGFSQTLLHWFRIDATPYAHTATFAITFIATVAVGWGLFIFLYRTLPEMPVHWRPLTTGALMAAIGFAVLQNGFSVIMGIFSRNAGTAVFGSLIVIMLSLNLFAMITLFIAAWIATSTQPAIALKYSRFDAPLRQHPDRAATVPGHWEAAELDREQQLADKIAKEHAAQLKNPEYVSLIETGVGEYHRPIGPEPAPPMPQFKRYPVKVGWGIGVATGLGLGAAVVSRLIHHRRH